MKKIFLKKLNLKAKRFIVYYVKYLNCNFTLKEMFIQSNHGDVLVIHDIY